MLWHKYGLKIHVIEKFVCKINYDRHDLRHLIQILNGHSTDLWPFPFLQKTLSDHFNNMKMIVAVKLVSTFNRHQGRQLCCVKRNDLVIE